MWHLLKYPDLVENSDFVFLDQFYNLPIFSTVKILLHVPWIFKLNVISQPIKIMNTKICYPIRVNFAKVTLNILTGYNLKLIVINRTVQLLLLIMNTLNLKVLISDLLLFVFQFHIPFAALWFWKHTIFTLLCRLRYPLNLSSEQRKVSLELLEKIKYKSLLVRKLWSAWYKICSWPTQFS